MDKQKAGIIAAKVKAFLTAFFGVVFFSLGTSYFQEQLVYRVPRILIPVYNLLGSIGLATAMLLLGGGLIVYGFIMWKRVARQLPLFWIVIIASLGVGIFLANKSDKKQSGTEIMQDMEAERQSQIEDLRDEPRPDFDNPEIDKHLDRFDAMYKKYEQSIAGGETTTTNDAMQEYSDWSTETASLMTDLSIKQKTELARYQASLGIKWSDLMQKVGK